MLENIETIEDWNDLQKMLLEFDYRIWQMPYYVNGASEFHALFKSRNDYSVDVITHNQEVTDAILAYPYW